VHLDLRSAYLHRLNTQQRNLILLLGRSGEFSRKFPEECLVVYNSRGRPICTYRIDCDSGSPKPDGHVVGANFKRRISDHWLSSCADPGCRIWLLGTHELGYIVHYYRLNEWCNLLSDGQRCEWHRKLTHCYQR
jgi:hypothetical protein